MEETKVDDEVQLEKSASLEKGVVYLSQVPTMMQPVNVRCSLSKFGAVGRIYLVPKDGKKGSKRTKQHSLTSYGHGWVEFERKQVAKSVAMLLNATPVEGSRRNPWHGELWNLRYLTKFKWHHLMEVENYKKHVRSDKLNAQLSRTRKENNHYLGQVEKRRQLVKMIQRKEVRAEPAAQ